MPDDRFGTYGGGTTTAASPAPGLVDHALQTLRDARSLVYDHLELAALEAQRAADGIVRLLVGAVVVAILVVSAWMAVVFGAILWASDEGLSLTVTMLCAALANVIVAGGVFIWMNHRVPELLFAATLRQLRAAAGKAPDHGDDLEPHARA